MNFLIYVLEDTQETAQFDVTRTRQFYNGILGFLIFLKSAGGFALQFWIRSSLTFSLSALRPTTDLSICAVIPVRTFFSWAPFIYIWRLWW